MDNYRLKWQKDFDTWFDIYQTFVIDGLTDDLQPYRESEDGPITYLPLCDYLARVYNATNEKESRRKLVISYDPSEAEALKFHIYGDNGMVSLEDQQAAAEEAQEEDEDNKPQRIKLDQHLEYTKELSQRFSDILTNEEINKILIGHDSEGPSLDIAKMHYAITYESNRSDSFLDRIGTVLENLFKFGHQLDHDETGYLFIIKMSSRLLSSNSGDNGLSAEELTIFRELLTLSQILENDEKVKGKHKLVILANNASDLPKWFVNESINPFIKTITVSKPSEANRKNFFDEMYYGPDRDQYFEESFVNSFEEAQRKADADKKANPFYNKFFAYTNDFSTKQLIHYREYLKDHKLADPSKIGFSVSNFIVGDMTNPWDDPEKVRKLLDIKNLVSRKIQGQEFALQSAQDILKRAALGLDRDENPNAPRAVLFLAGPTGTGKTEICKQIAEVIFGSEERIIRFDMSEFGQQESDQKLFGAPPGYVGYEEGGKLTNAVKKEPFSLVLFDEIEKAHPSILDKFLQILGDGRLTDGHGETVRFTDCIIAITSNAGVETKFTIKDVPAPTDTLTSIYDIIDEEKKIIDEKGEISPEDEKAIYQKVRRYLEYNVKAYFYSELHRPELYGRVEDSLVYYNYIGRRSVLPIASSKINSVIRTASQNYLIKIEVSDEVRAKIADACQTPQVRGIGARGIIKKAGKLFSTSLSDAIGEYLSTEGGKENIKNKTFTAYVEGEVVEPNDIKWKIE